VVGRDVGCGDVVGAKLDEGWEEGVTEGFALG
jgi:hypothetical protein